MSVSINICNLALGELRASPIADIAEGTLESQNCARYYPQCLALLLERYEWSFATRIAALSALTANDRAGEWRYTYALPTDVATPKRLVPAYNGGTNIGGYCWPFAFLPQPRWWQSFIVEAGVLYAQVPNAVLEYSANTISEAAMPAMFVDALTYSLAARLAIPIRDSRETKGELLKQAELALQRAWADDRNRQPERDDAEMDEVSFARMAGI